MKPVYVFAALTLAVAGSIAIASPKEAAMPASAKPFDFLGFTATVLLDGADTGGQSALLDVKIPANAGPPPHMHTREDEVFVIKKGTFQFFMDGVCLQAGPGATLYMPKGHMHTFKNVSKHEGEQLMFVYPAGLERLFREIHGLGLQMPKDFGKLSELSKSKYGIDFDPKHDFKAGACKPVASAGAK